MIVFEGDPIEFDFFMDEDTRSNRIGILIMEKRLTPALTQALFRIRQNADSYHKLRIESNTSLTMKEKEQEKKLVTKQMREIKWSSLNLIRSFIAGEFLKQFFQYWAKGPLPIMFFNSPFIDNHQNSINLFFDRLDEANINVLNARKNTQSVFILDSFNTPAKYKFEKEIMNRNNLSRCYRLDSRVHDLLQMTDLLLGVTVFAKKKKKSQKTSKPKLNLFNQFKKDEEFYLCKRKDQDWNPIYYL